MFQVKRFRFLAGAVRLSAFLLGVAYALKIGFTPVSPSSYSGQLTLMDTSAKPIAQVSMQGQGVSPICSPVDGKRCESELRQRDGEHGDDAVVDADIDRHIAGDGELGMRSRGLALQSSVATCRLTLNPTESMTLQVQFDPTSPGAASGQITISSNSSTGSTAVGDSEWYWNNSGESSDESSVDGERCESELRQRDGEHGDDAVVDADVDGDIAGNGELGCDHGCWLYDRRGQLAGDAEPDAIDDAAGAVPADSNWGSERTDLRSAATRRAEARRWWP